MRFAFKAVIVFFLTLGLLIPLMLIHGTIQEREAYREQAIANVAATSAGKQAVLGPVLVVPYVELVEQDEVTPQGTRKVLREQAGKWTFFPETLAIDGTMKPDTRRRGLYRVPVYELDMHAVAAIRAQIPADGVRPRRIGRPFLSVGASDVRGFVGTPALKVNGKPVALKAGFGSQPIGGVHARLDAPAAGQALALDLAFDAVIGGTEALALVPIARDNRFALKSSWPDPIFGGSFLPRTRTVDANGFRAQWEISSLATSAQTSFVEANEPASLLRLASMRGADTATSGIATSGIDAVGVTLFDAVDSYTFADRATKYGILFVLLTFVGFFMFELIKQLPIHPIQYGLVGLALAIFFLLLVSLSEHIPFGSAYLASAAACIGLLGFYLSAVLRSVLRGMGFAGMLALLYAALYGVLVSEDNALVLGAGLLFVVLATVMVVTRKVDWYALQR